MGKIGPRQQRFDVLPVPQWDLGDLLAQWRTEAPAEHPTASSTEPVRDLQSAAPDDR